MLAWVFLRRSESIRILQAAQPFGDFRDCVEVDHHLKVKDPLVGIFAKRVLDDREERNQRPPLPGQPVGLVAGPAIFGDPDLLSQLAVLPQSLLRDRARRPVTRGIMFGRIPETRKLGEPRADLSHVFLPEPGILHAGRFDSVGADLPDPAAVPAADTRWPDYRGGGACGRLSRMSGIPVRKIASFRWPE